MVIRHMNGPKLEAEIFFALLTSNVVNVDGYLVLQALLVNSALI